MQQISALVDISLLSKAKSTETHIFKINLKILKLVDTHENFRNDIGNII